MTDSTTRIGCILTYQDSVVNPRQTGVLCNSGKPAQNPIYMLSMHGYFFDLIEKSLLFPLFLPVNLPVQQTQCIRETSESVHEP